jgi:hypothetical protein
MSLNTPLAKDPRQIRGLGRRTPCAVSGKRPALRFCTRTPPADVALTGWMALKAVRHDSKLESAPAATLAERCMAETPTSKWPREGKVVRRRCRIIENVTANAPPRPCTRRKQHQHTPRARSANRNQVLAVWSLEALAEAQKGKRQSGCAGRELAGKSAAHATLRALPAHEHLRAFIDYGARLEIVPLAMGGYSWDAGHGHQNPVVACRVRKTKNGDLGNLRTRNNGAVLFRGYMEGAARAVRP